MQIVKLFLPLLGSFVLCSGAFAQEFRTFSTTDGASSVRAALVDVETDKAGARVAVLRREAGGADIRVRLDKLSAEDVKYVLGSDRLLSVPKTMRGRLSPGSRAVLRQKHGSSAAAEDTVEKALQWLSSHQNPNGSWGASHPAAMTGLTLLAFAGHGYGPGSDRHGEALNKGIAWLLEISGKNPAPFSGVLSGKPATVTSTYEHAIATQALAEMYALSQSGKKAPPGLAEAVAKAENIILSGQSPSGAWGYKDGIGYDRYGGNDLSLTGWQIHAIRACREAGLKNEKRSAVLQRVTAWLKSKQTSDGGFGNTNRGNPYSQWTLTGSALSGLQDVGNARQAVDRGVNWLLQFTRQEPLKWESDCYLYTWYYNSLAMHGMGGEAWKTWNDQCEQLLLTNQNPDGSWKIEGVGEMAAGGSGAAGADKDIYRTCLATLILETPCRFVRAETAK